MAYGVAGGERIGQTCHCLQCFCGKCPEAFTVGEFYIFLREVELQFEQCSKVYELIAQGFKFSGKHAAHLRHRHPVCRARRRCYHVCHTFCFCEVHFSCSESAAGEFSRFGEAASTADQQVDERTLYIGGAMHRKLHHVVAGERCGVTENRGHGLVQRLVAIIGVDDHPQMCRV